MYANRRKRTSKGSLEFRACESAIGPSFVCLRVSPFVCAHARALVRALERALGREFARASLLA